MNFEKTTLLYFSPTRTTRTILEQIALGMKKEVSTVIDITRPEIRSQAAPVVGDEIVLIGAPVYGGRLPGDAADYFKTLQAQGTPAVLVVVYGNREFEDALLELKDIAMAAGFCPLAAGAFIGEHSFTGTEFSIAPLRPDKKDLDSALSFGQQISTLLNRMDTPAGLAPLDVPGNFPYKDPMPAAVFPFIEVTADCDGCGICVTVCPRQAIDESDTYATIDDCCIHCCACIKACPTGARILKDSPMKEKARWLSENCAVQKEPQTFLARFDSGSNV